MASSIEGVFPANLNEFLAEARVATWVGDARVSMSRDILGVKKYVYTSDKMCYVNRIMDSFSGMKAFSGFEYLFDSPFVTKTPRVSMNYSGGLHPAAFDLFGKNPEEVVFSFLKNVLRDYSKYARMGGMLVIKRNSGDLLYIDKGTREEWGCSGEEYITFGETPIYSLKYSATMLEFI